MNFAPEPAWDNFDIDSDSVVNVNISRYRCGFFFPTPQHVLVRSYEYEYLYEVLVRTSTCTSYHVYVTRGVSTASLCESCLDDAAETQGEARMAAIDAVAGETAATVAMEKFSDGLT